MSARPHRFVVPVNGVTTFCTFLDGNLVPENPLPEVEFARHSVDPEFGWVAWAADSGKAIGRAHLDAVEGEGGFARLPMPADYSAGCLLFHRQVLFVGGNCGKEILGSFDFAAPEPAWTPLPVPEQFRRYGKRMDDLLLDGDRLIAVDDVVEPKYLLRYDAADPRAPRLLDVREIPWHSSYETIHSGAIGADWVALFSTSMNHGWAGIHVALFDRETLTERGSLTQTAKGSYGREGEAPRDWQHVALHGNTLLVAAGMDGVGVLNLDALGADRPLPARGTRALGGGSGRREFGERCLAAMAYHPLPARYVGYRVVRVVPVPGTRYYLATADTEPGFDTVVMELP